MPPAKVPDSLGVHIHFIAPKPGEMQLLQQSGIKWVRKPLVWDETEKQKGVYDFSSYDALMKDLEAHGLRVMFTLSFANPLYDGGLSPHTDEGRRAFARWAAAGVQRYKNRGVVWEIWNEPDYRPFWFPKPNVHDYILLSKAVIAEIRKVAPDEIIVGPSTSKFPKKFLTECFKAGLLQQWNAITVHPYRWSAPETVEKDYRRLRQLMKKFSPDGKLIPVLSGEWGYPAVEKGLNETLQSKYLPRMWLVNLANDIPLSIWYDWINDGDDPKNTEHTHGIVDRQMKPKPDYRAAQTLTRLLQGYSFIQRLPWGKDRDYLYLFNNGVEDRLVAWTTSSKPSAVHLPEGWRNFDSYDYLGEKLPDSSETQTKGRVLLVDSPQYFIFKH